MDARRHQIYEYVGVGVATLMEKTQSFPGFPERPESCTFSESDQQRTLLMRRERPASPWLNNIL